MAQTGDHFFRRRRPCRRSSRTWISGRASAFEVDGHGVHDGMIGTADVDVVGEGEFFHELGVGAFDEGVIGLDFGPVEGDFEGLLIGGGKLVVYFHVDGRQQGAAVEGILEEHGLGAGGDVGDGGVADVIPGRGVICAGEDLVPGFAGVVGGEDVHVAAPRCGCRSVRRR